MKKIILGALLAGTFAAQSASAEIRIFDFTASVSTLGAQGNAQTAPGIIAGTTIKKGDVITGQFSFDDQDRDWTNATQSISLQSAKDFNLTFNASGTEVSLGSAAWGHTPNVFGQSIFTLGGTNADLRVNGLLTLFSPKNAFEFDIDSDSTGSLVVSWGRGAAGKLTANLTSLAEVSPVPEPSTYGMLLLGAAIVGGAAKRRAARRAA